MKITQDLRAEVVAMTPEAQEQLAGMRAKSHEFMAGGGRLYIDQS